MLEQAKQVAGVQVNSEQNELIVTEALAGEAVTALKEALVASNSTAQASALEGHNQAILALEKCPVCSGRAPLVFQSPLGFKANCLDKSAQRAICAWSRPGVFLNSQYRSPLGLRWLDEGHLRLGRWLAPEMIPGR